MSTPAEWGPEFVLSTETNVSQIGAEVIALPDGRFVAVWRDNSQFFEVNGYISLRLQVFNTDGSKSGEEILIKEGASVVWSDPQIALLSDGRIVLTHVGNELVGTSIRIQIFNPDGTTDTPETTIAVSTGVPQNVTVGALPNGTTVLAWYDPLSQGVLAQIIDPDGSKIGSEISVNPQTGGSGQQITVLSDGRFVISWSDDSQSGGDQSGRAVRAQIFEQDGTTAGGPFLLNALTDSTQEQATTAALAGGGFVAVWRDGAFNSGDSSAVGISAQIFDANGAKVGGQFLVNSTTADVQQRPEVAVLPDGGFVVAWFDHSVVTLEHPFISIKAQAFAADGQKAGAEFEVSSIAFFEHYSLSIAVLPDGRFVVTWDDDGQTKADPSFLGAYAQIFDPRSGAVDVVGTSADEQLAGTVFDDTISGGAGNDELFGAAGADALFGDEDDDILSGGPGGDALDGGSGNDTASYENSTASVVVDLSQPAVNTGDAAGDIYVSIENLRGSLLGDSLVGDAGDNILSGLAGADHLTGGLGDDTLDGGSGTDTANYRPDATGGVTVDLSVSGAQNTGAAGSDTLISIEHLWGTDFADTLTGDSADNLIQGFAGADTLDGGAGFDTLSYASSSGGVSVDLQTGQGSLGHATGDIVVNFEAIIGSDHNDQLTGDNADNVLSGGAGADVLAGGGGEDTASYATSGGSVVADLLFPGLNSGDAAGDSYVSIENLVGSSFDDLLFGDGGANRIDGNGGDDIVEGGAGADQLNGGGGFDVLSYANSLSGVIVNLDTSTVAGGDATGDTIVSFEDIFGSGFDDALTGDAGDNFLEGGAGADHLDGLSGHDTVTYVTSSSGVTVNIETGLAAGGDAAGDTFASIENIIGSEFDDVLTPSGFAATTHYVLGGGGNDIINAGASGSDQLFGGSGDDALTGNFNNNVLDGGAGRDSLDGGTGTDLARYVDSDTGVTVDLIAGTGAGGHAEGDQLTGIENIDGSAFADQLTGDASSNFFNGADGNDVLSGGSGDDRLDGGSGDDLLDGGEGADALVGGKGVDLASYAGSGLGVTVNLERGVGVGGDASGDSLEGIENVRGSQFGDTLIGDAAANVLYGQAGDDSLFGGGGHDQLYGGAGADDLDGGSGFDLARYIDSSTGVTVNLTTGTGAGGDAEGDQLTGIEHVLGSNFDDVLTGDAGKNFLYGQDGNDQLFGLAGDDKLFGGGGHDHLYAGAGAELLDGGSGFDLARYITSSAAVTVSLTTGSGSGGDAEGDQLVGIEHVQGSNFNDVLTGDAGKNFLYGQDGNDQLFGLAGDDKLFGGGGHDHLYAGVGAELLDGGTGFDLVRYINSSAGVTVSLTTGLGSGGDAEGDQLVGIEHVQGSNFEDVLTGDQTKNFLYGLGGNDTFFGLGGDDRFFGGAGNDTFVFGADGGANTVHDFSAGAGSDDVLDISDFSFASLSDVLSSANQSGGDVVITLDGATSVTLLGTSLGALHEDDFLFV